MFKAKWMYSLVLIVSLLVLSVSPASAASFPLGHTPPLGDEEPPQIDDFTPMPTDISSLGQISVDAVANPSPIAPYQQFVYSRTPKFFFSPKTNATQYHISVVDIVAEPDKVVYNYYGTGGCTNICKLQPGIALKTYRYQAIAGGVYLWYVEAMVGGVWQGFTTSAPFAVLSTGFSSTFDTSTDKWQYVSGTWALNGTGAWKAVGPSTTTITALQKEIFTTDFVYEVRMKRKTETGSLNRIIFMGTPDPLAANKTWDTGYYFGYDNNGTWSFWRRDGGLNTTLLYDSVPSPYVVPYGWNTLTVWTDYPNFYLWINGAYLGMAQDATYRGGLVGVGMYEIDAAASSFLVDSARLYYSATGPYELTGAQLGAPLNRVVTGEVE